MYEGRSLGFSLPDVHQSSSIHWYFRHGKRRGSRNPLLRGIYRACLVAAVCFGWSCIYMLTIKLNVYVLCWVLRTVNRVGMLYMACDIYDMLIHRGGVTNICIGKLGKHWSMACQCQDIIWTKCSFIVCWIFRSKLQWNLNQNLNLKFPLKKIAKCSNRLNGVYFISASICFWACVFQNHKRWTLWCHSFFQILIQ